MRHRHITPPAAIGIDRLRRSKRIQGRSPSPPPPDAPDAPPPKANAHLRRSKRLAGKPPPKPRHPPPRGGRKPSTRVNKSRPRRPPTMEPPPPAKEVRVTITLPRLEAMGGATPHGPHPSIEPPLRAFSEQLRLTHQTLTGADLRAAVELLLEEVKGFEREVVRARRDEEMARALASVGLQDGEDHSDDDDDNGDDYEDSDAEVAWVPPHGGQGERGIVLTTVECCICFELVVHVGAPAAAAAGSTSASASPLQWTGAGATLTPCNHQYCHACMASWLAHTVGAGEVVAKTLACAQPGCGAGLLGTNPLRNNEGLERAVGREAFAGAVLGHLLGVQRVVRCPRRGEGGALCGGFVGVDDEAVKMLAGLPASSGKGTKTGATAVHHCTKCNEKMCGTCKFPAHGGLTCATATKLREKQGMDEADVRCVELAQKKGWGRCPRCGFVVDKVSGCDNVQCRCGQSFHFTRMQV
ncbi:hypothetical protein HDU96_008500 [Phlyctochytrium bullatum]|nr:hypothetical protein HDU96_008500 [Phlyctochytrium bullatum]